MNERLAPNGGGRGQGRRSPTRQGLKGARQDKTVVGQYESTLGKREVSINFAWKLTKCVYVKNLCWGGGGKRAGTK